MGKKANEHKTGETVTLQTIADAMQVSRATVSNAFNRPDQLTPELRAKILAKAKELKYGGPDAAAAVLRKGRTDTIGVIFTEALSYALTDPVALSVLQGIAKETEEAEIRLLLIPTAADRGDISPVRDAVVDSFILWSLPDTDPQRLAALARRLPVVIVDGTPDPEAAWIGIDERSGLETLIARLLQLGHRRFGVITWPLAEDGFQRASPIWNDERRSTPPRGNDSTVCAKGWKPPALPGRTCPCSNARSNTQEKRCARRGGPCSILAEPPTAILCMSDLLAFGAMQTAAARGLAVPGDLSITGFDDIPAAARAHPPLTTIRQPFAIKGGTGGTFSARRLDRPAAPQTASGRDVWRESAGPVSA